MVTLKLQGLKNKNTKLLSVQIDSVVSVCLPRLGLAFCGVVILWGCHFLGLSFFGVVIFYSKNNNPQYEK